MKLKLFDKIMLGILLVFMFVALIALSIACIFPSFLERLAWVVIYIANNLFLRILVLLISLLLLFLLVRIFFVRKRDDDPTVDKKLQNQNVLYKTSESNSNSSENSVASSHFAQPEVNNAEIKISSETGGSSFISSSLIKQIVENEIRTVDGVASGSASIQQDSADETGISVRLDVAANADQVLPKLSNQLQETIRNSVENKTGVNVRNVEVNFSSIIGDGETAAGGRTVIS